MPPCYATITHCQLDYSACTLCSNIISLMQRGCCCKHLAFCAAILQTCQAEPYEDPCRTQVKLPLKLSLSATAVVVLPDNEPEQKTSQLAHQPCSHYQVCVLWLELAAPESTHQAATGGQNLLLPLPAPQQCLKHCRYCSHSLLLLHTLQQPYRLLPVAANLK